PETICTVLNADQRLCIWNRLHTPGSETDPCRASLFKVVNIKGCELHFVQMIGTRELFRPRQHDFVSGWKTFWVDPSRIQIEPFADQPGVCDRHIQTLRPRIDREHAFLVRVQYAVLLSVKPGEGPPMPTHLHRRICDWQPLLVNYLPFKLPAHS